MAEWVTFNNMAQLFQNSPLEGKVKCHVAQYPSAQSMASANRWFKRMTINWFVSAVVNAG